MSADDQILLLDMGAAERGRLARSISRLGYGVILAEDLPAAQAIWEPEASLIVIVDMRDRYTQITELRAQEELARIRPPLDGRQVMEFLGVAPGPIVGRALTFLLDLRLDEGPLSDADAYARLAAWAKEQGIDVEPGAQGTSY